MYYIEDTIYLKEIAQEKLYNETSYADDKKVIAKLFEEIEKDSSTKGTSDMDQKVQKILNKFLGAARSFGLYDQEQRFGYVSFANYDSDTPEIQIEITDKYQKRGIGYKSLSFLIEKLFYEREDIQYFLYRVRADNVASLKLIEKLGGQLIETGQFIDKIIKRYHIFKK